MTSSTRSTSMLLAALAALAPITAVAQPAIPDESTPAPGGVADIQPAPPQRATVLHVAPAHAVAGEPLTLVAVVDDAWTEAALLLRFRSLGTAAGYQEAVFERSSAGGYYATVEAPAVARPGIEYWIAGRRPDGAELAHFASPDAPHRVPVEPSLHQRRVERERARLADRLSAVAIDVGGHDFGNRYGDEDRYLRGEITWSHVLLLPRLHAISLGYGFIEGRTPIAAAPDATSVRTGARYGHAGVVVRAHSSVWFDLRANLGVDRDELIIGGSAKATLGQPWGASVDLGAEWLERLGPTLFVRLQWDTVPHVLMGAGIYKTDLPAARLTGGSLIRYDLAYPIGRMILRANVSYGSREGAARFGGGLGTELRF